MSGSRVLCFFSKIRGLVEGDGSTDHCDEILYVGRDLGESFQDDPPAPPGNNEGRRCESLGNVP